MHIGHSCSVFLLMTNEEGQSLAEWGIDWKDDSVTDTKYWDKSGVECVSFQESLKLWPVVCIE